MPEGDLSVCADAWPYVWYLSTSVSESRGCVCPIQDTIINEFPNLARHSDGTFGFVVFSVCVLPTVFLLCWLGQTWCDECMSLFAYASAVLQEAWSTFEAKMPGGLSEAEKKRYRDAESAFKEDSKHHAYVRVLQLVQAC